MLPKFSFAIFSCLYAQNVAKLIFTSWYHTWILISCCIQGNGKCWYQRITLQEANAFFQHIAKSLSNVLRFCDLRTVSKTPKSSWIREILKSDSCRTYAFSNVYGKYFVWKFEKLPLNSTQNYYLMHTLKDKTWENVEILDLRLKSSWAFGTPPLYSPICLVMKTTYHAPVPIYFPEIMLSN